MIVKVGVIEIKMEGDIFCFFIVFLLIVSRLL